MSSSPVVDIGLEYAEKASAGKILVPQNVKKATDRFFRMADKYEFDVYRVEAVVEFLQRLQHVKGRWAGGNFILSPWQVFGLCGIYGFNDNEGRRLVREVYFEVARKNGKSPLAAGIGLFHLCDPNDHGAEVYSGATSEKQAWEVFRPAKKMVEADPELQEEFDVTPRARRLEVVSDGSRFEPIIRNPGDGSSPSVAIVDEYHEHQTPNLYETMETGMGAREEPLLLVITTAGTDLEGPCYEKRKEIIDILDGAYEKDHVFGLIYGIDKGDDWTSETALAKANPNMDVSVSKRWLLDQQASAKISTYKQNAFRTKHLNEWVGAREAWMNMHKWDTQPTLWSREDLKTRMCYVGLDLATKLDLAPVVYLFPPFEDCDHWNVHVDFYLPAKALEQEDSTRYATWYEQGYVTLTPGPTIDQEFIYSDIIANSDEFEIVELGYDPWQAAGLARKLSEQVETVEVRQTIKSFSPSMKQIEALVYAGALAHGDNPVLRWNISNIVAREDNKENVFPVKERKKSKIDGGIALLIANDRAMANDSEGVSIDVA